MIYFGLLRANVSKDQAQIGTVFLGGWLFSQLPKYVRVASSEYELQLIHSYSTLRSYLVGMVVAVFIARKYLFINYS